MFSRERIFFYLPAVILIFFSCILIGFSIYLASVSISIDIPDFSTKNPSADLAHELTEYSGHMNDAIDYSFRLMGTGLGLLASTLFILICFLIIVLFYWGKDRKKISRWKEIGFLCERLEILEANKIKINQTELLLNRAQHTILEKLVNSRIKGEPLHSIDIGDNATQIIKRLREELGSKLIEKTFIVNHRGKGYWVNINPKKIKISKN